MKRSELFFSAVTLPLDYLAILLAAIVAYFLRYLPAIQRIRPVIFDLPFSDYFTLASSIAVGWTIIFTISGLYAMGRRVSVLNELGRVFVSCTAGMALVLAVMVFNRYLFDSRFMIIASWLLAILFVSIERLIVRLIQRLAYRGGLGVHRVALVGDGHIARVLAEEFAHRPVLGYRVVRQWNECSQAVFQELADLAEADKVDEVIQINPGQSAELSARLIQLADDYHLIYRYSADLLGAQLTNHEVATLAGTPIIEVKRTRLDGWGRIVKRIFDIAGSTLLILLFLPISFVTAIAIKIDSPGPVFFSYRRIGAYGKQFMYFKFRSMVKDAHKLRFDQEFLAIHPNLRDGSPMIKFADDPRITRVGKFIRRFSIDEFPELILVLIGKMSLVGPRPHEIEEVQRYHQHHRKLLSIKPGVTGLAQVSGRSDLNFEDEVKLDTYYIENWSLGMDLQILLKTPLAILRPRASL